MENNKIDMNELEKLVLKIGEANKMTKMKQFEIDNMKKELMEETRPMMVEQRKKEIAGKEKDKKSFDGMTKNALKRAKKAILQIREQSEKEYQEKLVKTQQRKKDIADKLKSMEQKGLQQEKVAMAQASAQKALGKVNQEMIEYQENHFNKRAKLAKFEKYIDALETGTEIDETIKAEIEDKTINNENVNEETNKQTVNEEANNENTNGSVVNGYVNGEHSNNEQRKETRRLVEVKVNGKKYEFTYEDNGELSTESKDKIGFFKGLKEKISLVRQGKLAWKTALRVDPTITQNLSENQLKEYIEFIEQRKDEKVPFAIDYGKAKGLHVKAFAKAVEKLGLPLPSNSKVDNFLNEKFGEGFDQHKNPPVIQENETEQEVSETVRNIMEQDEK